MEIKYNRTGNERKALVNAIAAILDAEATYDGAPTFNYHITDSYTVNRNGNLEVADGVPIEETQELIETLQEQGFEYEQEHTTVLAFPISAISAQPQENNDAATLEKLRAIIESYADLFRKAVDTDKPLAVEVTEERSIQFDWFDRVLTIGELAAYSTFLAQLFRFAETAKRVNGKRGEIENEKFTMRTFLNRIGLSGTEHKPLRKQLMKNLSGNSAFRYGRPETA